MKSPNVYTLEGLLFQILKNNNQILVDHEWHPTRPIGCPGIRYRLRAAWLVLTGKADAVTWPGGQ